METLPGLRELPRKAIAEMEFHENQADAAYEFCVLQRVSAVDKDFKRVSFKFVIFDDCYFRNCKFEDCDFTGAQFKDSSFRGSCFPGSCFNYTRFRNCRITPNLISQNLPGWENVALEFAQGLRVNFAQTGDVDGVNRAIKAELRATRVHLRKAAWSGETHYRNKYQGLERLAFGWRSTVFEIFEFVWGNGESLSKLFRTIALVIVICSLVYVGQDYEFEKAIIEAVRTFLGTSTTENVVPLLHESMAASRFVLLGLFVSVLVKRLSRR
ncbi:MAG: pentapeptide repeat-containing protein [Marinobacter sp.]|nr:pentapeptide repeat-containing protein [Marinobacter sp.]